MKRSICARCGWKFSRLSVAVLLATLILALPVPPAAGTESTGVALPSLKGLADQVKHAVVNISTTEVVQGGGAGPFQDFFGDEFSKRFFGNMPQGSIKRQALGSGVIIDRGGLILTNNHVVEKATEIRIKLESGKEYDAEVVGRDPKTDLALIRVKPDQDFPQPAVMGDSDVLQVGDWVMAVGNPFGLGHTVTVGIIGAKGRILGVGTYNDYLQTDAAINPGNSGGPLFNMKGEIVGINTAIVAQGQGIGFAIPINMVKELLDQLKTGKVVRGWLGVAIQDITPELAQSFNLTDTKGVLIAGIMKDSPAARAGFEHGDIVRRFNGKEMDNAHALSFEVARTVPESKVQVEVMRDGKPETITVTIGTMAEESEAAQPLKTKSTWGLSVQEITPEIAEHFDWDEDETGVVVSAVDSGSPAEEGGLHSGDLIKEANRQPVNNISDYNRIAEEAGKKGTLLLLVKRGQGTMYVVLKLPKKD